MVMRKILALILMAVSLLGAAPKKPKLVVAIVIDQFRYDYLTRYRSDYHGGFDLLLTKGARFTNARYQHFPTVTAVGHSIFLSGAMPALSGIVANTWYDREAGMQVSSVSDPETTLVGGLPGVGSSPRRMLVDTVGDELKIADDSQSRVIGISLKDRAAILPAAAQGNVEVVAQPTGERDVPAPPEVRHAGRQVRTPEVDREVKSEQLGHADGHVRVAGKIEIDL